MGLLRFIYATAVVFLHSAPILGFVLLSRDLAVWSFFIISGFYMGLILNEKYIGKNGSALLFITNRFLRIYPVYLVSLFMAVLIFVLFEFLKIKTPLHNYFLIQTNPLNQFFDLVRNSTLIIAPEYIVKPKVLPGFLILPQAWTLQLELLFYLFAPFLFKKQWYIIVLLLFAILFIDYLIIFPKQLFYSQPIVYRLFENIPFFLFGGISYKIYSFVSKKKINRKFLITLFLSFITLTLFYNYFNIKIPFIHSSHHTDWIYYLSLMFVIPFIFILCKQNKYDRLIGELSYPIYIIHTLAIVLVLAFSDVISGWPIYSLIVFLLTVSFAVALAILVDRRIDAWRQSRLELAQSKRKQFPGLFPNIRLLIGSKIQNRRK